MRKILVAVVTLAFTAPGEAFQPPQEVLDLEAMYLANLEGDMDTGESCEEGTDCHVHLEDALLDKIARGGFVYTVGNTTVAVKAVPSSGPFYVER